MHESFYLLVSVIVLAVIFDFINGFHDTANAIANSISTRVMTPRQAIILAALMNLIGALSGTAVAKTVGSGLVIPVSVTQVTILAALGSAILWNLLTWFFGIPSSSSHALLSSIVGAAIATSGTDVIISTGVLKIFGALILTPLLCFALGWFVMYMLSQFLAQSNPSKVNRVSQRLQIFSAAFMAFSHGNNDAQKTMGIITLALFSYGAIATFDVPDWVIYLCAVAMALGTAIGGWRIIKTLGVKLASMKPINGFAADTTAASVIECASQFGLPLSTTHIMTSAIMGVAASRRVSAVRWGIGGNIVITWVLTIPLCGLMAWVLCFVAHLIFG
jgi:inorganic phosphate transporter, PiT family